MKVIITGSSGFIGKNLILKAPKNWEVIALYNQSLDFPEFIKKHGLKNVIPQRCDLIKEESVKALIKNTGDSFDICIYLSANANPALSTGNPLGDLEQNVFALINFLNQIKIGRLIFFSSGAVYGKLSGLVSPDVRLNPILPYAITKLSGEYYIQFFNNKGNVGEYIILRFFGAYGPYEPKRKVYTKLVKAFYFEKKNEFIVRGSGGNFVDAMYIDDAMEGLIKVIESHQKNLTIDFCCGHPISIDVLVKSAASIFDRNNIEIIHEGVVPEYISFRASPIQMNKLFGFEPRISLEEGFIKLAKFLKEQEK